MSKNMKKISLLLVSLFFIIQSNAQNGAGDDFERATLGSAWTGNGQYNLFIPSTAKGQLLASCTAAGVNYTGFTFTFPAIDVTFEPYISLKVKVSADIPIIIRIDMIDASGNRTNKVDTKQTITRDNTYHEYLFDFSNKFVQQDGTPVLSNSITKIEIMVNPANAGTLGYNGNITFDDVMIGSFAKSDINGTRGIKLNQLGFFTKGFKQAVVNGATTATPKFYIVNESANDTLNPVFKGSLSTAKVWSGYSDENVRIADFTNFKTPGKYKMYVTGIKNPSNTFSINSTVLNSLSKGSIKGFYFQRASISLPAQYAGKWQRAAGHPDTKVVIHPSAASVGRPAGAIISSPRGWYDAGDYNKYIVNSGISTYTLLACYEHFPAYYDTLSLNIPESNNGVPDVLDEALWNVRWMLTMQDPYDGGVYHKLTNKDFDGDIMPSGANTTRYVVQKSSAATLDFAAVMAQASRIYANYESKFPGLSDSCIKAAARAYEWATVSSPIFYTQKNMSNPPITTGSYENGSYSDEQSWAAAEIFVTTQKKWYYTKVDTKRDCDIPDWPNVYTLGIISMAHNRLNIVDSLPKIGDTTMLKNKVIKLADTYVVGYNNSAYSISMGTNNWDFGWGSNSRAANQSLVLIQAFNYTKDSSYLKAALANLDYLTGRNPTGYCYVTGFGTKPSNNIHHRPSQADGVPSAVPGLLVGGPNPGQQDKCPGYPANKQPAFSYVDSECSYATNEIAINWNAPLAYISGSLQSIFSGIQPEARSQKVFAVTDTKSSVVKNVVVNIFPNPTSSTLFVTKPFDLIEAPVILDLNGIEYPATGNWSNETFEINTSGLSNGMYLIRLQGENGAAIQKFTVIK